MNASSVVPDSERTLTNAEVGYLALGISAAQTSYELNNGLGIRVGSPLEFLDDAKASTLPGARPFKMASLEGFVVQEVFNNNATGLNAFLAFNKDTKVILIGVAGTNGFGSDLPDTKSDIVQLGVDQSLEILSNREFKSSIENAIDSIGGAEHLSKIVIGGQSLGGGIAPTIALGLANTLSRKDDQYTFQALGISAEKIFAVSFNGFGNEYSAELAGFTKEQIDSFNAQASLHRIVVKNVKTGEYDLVSQLGGKFSGTDWILSVEVANGLGPLHRLNFGGAEGIDNLYGDLTLLRPGQVPSIDHATVARNLFWLDTHLKLPNNPVSLSWASYVALLASKPGEGSATLSAVIQSVTSLPKPFADLIGVVSEFALRALPVTHAAQALQFLVGGYLGGKMIGSIASPQPVFDFDKAFGPVQAGWSRMFEKDPGNNLPAFVIDTDPQTQVTVIKRMDGRSVEIHPDGSQIQTHPDYGMAVISPDGQGTLFLKTTDPVTGDTASTTVFIKPGSTLKLEAEGWQVLTPVDQNEGLYSSVLYRGSEARQREIQFNTDADGVFIDKMSVTSEIIRQLPQSDHILAAAGGTQQTIIRLSANHTQLVLRDDDRRMIQVVDVITSGNRSETSYRDGQGNLQKKITVEQLNTEASRTTIIGESGDPVESTVFQRYRRGGEIYELEDQIDYTEGTRLLTVRDSHGHVTRADSVPIGDMSDAYREMVRDQLDNDVADFLTALRQKDAANIILSAARIALDYSRSQGTATLQHDNLVSDASSGLALVTSLRSIQSGDTLAKIGGAVGLLNSTNYLATRMMGSGYLSPAQLGALSQMGAMLSIANLANLDKMIEAGQVGSAGASVISAINGIGYLSGAGSSMMGAGAIIAINPIAMVVTAFALDSLFGEEPEPPPPPPQASASFYRGQNGALRYRISNANPLGESILRRELDQLLVRLDQQLQQANSAITAPTHQLQLVASRMPSIQISAWPSLGGNGITNYFFVVSQQDPLRSEPITLGIARQDLVSLYAETLLLPEAIVQRWELDHLRIKFGDNESSWQTEAEWLRERSPTERIRAQLQADLERSTMQWKAAAKLNLMLSDGPRTGDHPFNVIQLGLTTNTVDVVRADMTKAQEKLTRFNIDHPIDPLQAARTTPNEALAFARQRNVLDTVSMQWLKVIAIDLGNDGVQVIDLPGKVGTDLESLQKQRVPRFDVDGDGFREATQWIEPADAILGIDRSGNGLIDNGSEIFNGADTPFDQHGLASLAYFDANHDGLITPIDPAFRQLRLWIDLDGDGSAGQLEVFDLWMRSVVAKADLTTDPALASMVVTAVDLANSRLQFADGGTAKLTERDLLAHMQGVQISVDPHTANLNVLHESGLRENFITLVDDMSALQELLLPSLSAARRNELNALATRYGLNPLSSDFASIVQSLRATGKAMGEQETVIYFGDDDVWVNTAVRERLEQMRISFRKLGDTDFSNQIGPNLVSLGRSPKTEPIENSQPFDDRWVPSRRIDANDIRSDTPTQALDPVKPVEVRPIASQVYSLLAATKGAQVDGLVTQIPVISSDPASTTAGDTRTMVYSSAPPVANLSPLRIQSDEDSLLGFNYSQLARDAQLALPVTNETLRLRMVGIRRALRGDVQLDDDSGHLSFKPQSDYVGEAGFSYVLADQHGRLYERDVSINLIAVNDAPRTSGEAIVSTEDVPILIDSHLLLTNDIDVEGDSLTITGIARVALGRAELLGNGMIHYVPPSDQYDITDTLEYIVQDIQGASATASIRIRIKPAQDAPSVVVERIVNAREDQTLRIPQHLLLRNDIDLDTDARIGLSPLKISSVGSGVHGQVRLESDGEIVFTPDANFNGEARFSYTVMDTTGLSSTGYALVNIDAVNDAPLAAGEHVDSREDEVLLIDPALLIKNELDIDIQRGELQRLSVISVDHAIGGSVRLADGMINFTPDADHHGLASFQYIVSDGAGGFSQSKVDITLDAVNDAPRLTTPRLSTWEDTELKFSDAVLLAGASDVDSDLRSLVLKDISNIQGGILTRDANQLKFSPLKNFNGIASFDYTVEDHLGAASTATLMIDVNSVNDAPTFISGSRFEPVGNEDQEIRIAESALVKMFSDADGDTLSLDIASLTSLEPADRIRFDEARREVVFRAAPNTNGLREFSFKVSDTQLSSTAAKIGVMLRPVNDAPIVNAIGFQMLEDGGATDPTKSAWTYVSHSLMLSGTTDVEGDTLAVTKVADAQTMGGLNPQPVEVFNDAQNQRIGIRAPLNYTGAIVFDFTVSDGRGGETTQKAYGSVSAVNDVPFLTAQRAAISTHRIGFGFQNEVATWQISAWDPDTTQTVQIGIARNPLRGNIRITGTSAAPDSRGGMLTTATVTSVSGIGNARSNETAWFSATDSAGASAQISISFTGRYSTDPIVIDLDRDGFEFIDIDESNASFMIDGEDRRMAWIGPKEGILAYDADRDGRIHRMDEIAFGSHVGDATLSDLQALQRVTFDQNQDGIFDGDDAKWADFFLWQDLNGNGVSDTGELRSLAIAGIQGLFLNANVLNRAEGADVRVRGYTRALMHDGRLLQAADVWLGLDHPDRSTTNRSEPTMQQVSLLGAEQLESLLRQLAQAPQEGNRAPLVYGHLPTQFADEGETFRLNIAPNFFIDADAADPLVIDARLANGSPLPAWLKWDPNRLLLEGIPHQLDTGKLQLALIATDQQGASSKVSFTLVTSALNRAPIVKQAPAPVGWKIARDNQFQISDRVFIDPNKDDTLIYQVTVADGSDLPAWLQFDSNSATLSGKPAQYELMTPIRLKLSASDLGGLTTSTLLTIMAANYGTDADDALTGSDIDDYLQGFAGNDLLQGGAGSDILSGGSGDDVLLGAYGSDTYLFESEWGWDDIQELASVADNNVIRFGEGIEASDILLSRNLTSLRVRQSGTMDLINVSTTTENQSSYYQEGLVSAIQFANGEVWGALRDQDIAFEGGLDASHTNFIGSQKNDLIWTSWLSSTIQGAEGDDAIFGNSGDDQLFGGAGQDTLDGGSGSDLLHGGSGDDYYRVSTWSGNKTIMDTGGTDTLAFTDISCLAELTLSRSGTDLLTGFVGASGGIIFKDFFSADGRINESSGIDLFEFCDGNQITASALASAAGLLKTTGLANVITSSIIAA